MASLGSEGPPLLTDGIHFRESAGGRTVILRGVNFSAAAKYPKGQPLHQLEGFWETAENDGQPGAEEQVTYLGQLVDLQDAAADEHFARLRRWGFNCVRLIVVWEALEHQGPSVHSPCLSPDPRPLTFT